LILIPLTIPELKHANSVGKARNADNYRRGSRPAHGLIPRSRREDVVRHVVGAMGEKAVSKYLAIPWTGDVGGMRYAGDVGGMEVRTTTCHTGRLPLHPTDLDERIFIFVTKTLDETPARLHGWLYAHEGKLKRWWTDPQAGRFAFFVPRSHLRPAETLEAAYEALEASRRAS
jgi:hypothetical protein